MAELLTYESDANRGYKSNNTDNESNFSEKDFDPDYVQEFLSVPETSRLGNGIVNAANRINQLLVAGIEFRHDVRESAETTMRSAKEKVRQFGNSALLVGETVIGYGISGAESMGKGIDTIKDKAKGKFQDAISEAKLEYADFKDTIEFGKKDIKESFNNTKGKVESKIDGIKSDASAKFESARSFTSEKVDSVRGFFQQKRSEAIQRKEQRVQTREQAKLSREQNKVEAKKQEVVETKQPEVFTSPEATSILEATKAPEAKESKLGNTVLHAAERINSMLVSGVEMRETMKDNANKKLKAIGNSALFATEVVIGVGIQGKEVISKKVESTKEAASEKIKAMREAFKQKMLEAQRRRAARKEARTQFIKRAQYTGHAAREAWKNYKPDQSNV